MIETKSLGKTTPVHRMIVMDGKIGSIDNKSTVRLYDDEAFRSVMEQSFEAEVSYRFFKGNAVSRDGELLALYLNQKENAHLYRFEGEQYEPFFKLQWNEDDIEVTEICPNKRFLAAAGPDGKVCIYSMMTKSLVTILPRSSDYIASLAFSHDSNLIVYGCFNQNLTLYDLCRQRKAMTIRHDAVITDAAFLHRSGLLLFGDRNNRVTLFDVTVGRTVKVLKNLPAWPMQIFVDHEDRFSLVTDKNGNVHLIDLSGQEDVDTVLHKSKEVTVDIRQFGDRIVMLSELGAITTIDLKADAERILALDPKRELRAIYEVLENNPLVRYEIKNLLESLDEAFEEDLEKAVDALVKRDVEQAKVLMEPYYFNQGYQSRFKAFVAKQSTIANFIKFFEQKEYVKAYSVMYSTPLIKNSFLADRIEKVFEKAFTKALEAMGKKRPDKRAAQAYLKLFSGIETKSRLIHKMMNTTPMFVSFEAAFRKGNNVKCSTLLSEYDYLCDMPSAKRFIAQAEEVKFSLKQALAIYDFDRGIVIIKQIEREFPHLLSQITTEGEQVKVYQEFKIAMHKKQFGKAMQIASQNAFLMPCELYQKLNRFVAERMNAAMQLAVTQKFPKMDSLIRPFLSNEYTRDRAMQIYKLYYLEQILRFADKFKQDHWNIVVYNYAHRFGIDSEIEFVGKKYNQDKLLKSYEDSEPTLGHRYAFLPSIHVQCKAGKSDKVSGPERNELLRCICRIPWCNPNTTC